MNDIMYPILDFYGGPILFGLFITLYILEYYFTLRMPGEDRKQRLIRNGSLSALALPLVRLGIIPAMIMSARWANDINAGLLNFFELPRLLELGLTFLLLDYAMYLWHRLNHRIPFLWRFHNVHHTDLQLDITTAIRFHFGEIFFSIFYRAAIVILIGAEPTIILIYEIIFQASTAFHHSNLKLPLKFESKLVRLIVTPRMHGIHHSIYKQETDSNFSTIFSFWDLFHKTKKIDIPQDSVTIGVPAWRDIQELRFKNLVKLPFTKQRDWQLPDGEKPLKRKSNPQGGINY